MELDIILSPSDTVASDYIFQEDLAQLSVDISTETFKQSAIEETS